ncbi:MAG: hypothetical protein AAF456_10745 [Planctomycetota bacterium]
MDPLHFCIAIAPLSVYLLILGIINLSRAPFVTTGARDAAALAIAVLGLMIAGPMELFFPEGAASQFGGFVWIMLIVFYGLCVSLVVLLLRARIVVYNISMDQLLPVLKAISTKLDKNTKWVGNSLVMPGRNVHLHVEPVEWMRNVQLVAGGNQQSYEGWKVLERELSAALKPLRVGPNLPGVLFVCLSAVMAFGTAVWVIAERNNVAQAFDEMLRR